MTASYRILDEQTYLIKDVGRHHVRLQLVDHDGPDNGLRVHVPRRHPDYTEDVPGWLDETDSLDLPEDRYVTATLAEDTDHSKQWRLKDLDTLYDEL